MFQSVPVGNTGNPCYLQRGYKWGMEKTTLLEQDIERINRDLENCWRDSVVRQVIAVTAWKAQRRRAMTRKSKVFKTPQDVDLLRAFEMAKEQEATLLIFNLKKINLYKYDRARDVVNRYWRAIGKKWRVP